MNIQQLFYPIIGVSYQDNADYYEISPSDDLKSYIRCFWGFEYRKNNRIKESLTKLVIPDACSDIIFYAYKDGQTISVFCGIDHEPILPSVPSDVASYTFGIRFFGWGVSAFTDDSMKEVIQGPNMVERYFPGFDRLVKNAIHERMATSDLVLLVEDYFRHHYRKNHISQQVIQVVGDMAESFGGTGIDEIAKRNFISKRQLERDFSEYIGISPKKMAGIIRYQYVWQDILYKRQCNMDYMLAKYQYTDQAHMLNDFKKHHGMNWREALINYKQ